MFSTAIRTLLEDFLQQLYKPIKKMNEIIETRQMLVDASLHLLEKDNINLEYYEMKGISLILTDRHEEAIKYLDKAIEMERDSSVTLYNYFDRSYSFNLLVHKSMALYDLEKYNDAIETIDESINLCESRFHRRLRESPFPRRDVRIERYIDEECAHALYSAYDFRAHFKNEKGDYRGAMDDLIIHRKNNEECDMFLGQLKYKLGDKEGSEIYFKKVIDKIGKINNLSDLDLFTFNDLIFAKHGLKNLGVDIEPEYELIAKAYENSALNLGLKTQAKLRKEALFLESLNII